MNILGADPQILRDLDSKVRANLSTYQQRLRAEVVTVSSDGKKARVKLPGETPPYQRPLYPVQGRVAVGDSVWVLLDNGGLIIIAMDRFIADTDTSITNVKAGGLNDFSLVNSKYANDSQDSRSVGDFALQGFNMATGTVGTREINDGGVTGVEVAGRTLTGSLHLALRTVNTGEITLEAVRSGEVGYQSLINDNIGDGQVGNRIVAYRSMLNDNIGDGQVGSRIVGFRAMLGSNMASDSVGTVEANDAAISFVGHTHSSSPFIRYSKEERMNMLRARKALRDLDLTDEEELSRFAHLLRDNVETALKLHMDYIHMDAYEREEKLEKDEEWAKRYSDHYKTGRWEGCEPLQVLDVEEQQRRLIEDSQHPDGSDTGPRW